MYSGCTCERDTGRSLHCLSCVSCLSLFLLLSQAGRAVHVCLTGNTTVTPVCTLSLVNPSDPRQSDKQGEKWIITKAKLVKRLD